MVLMVLVLTNILILISIRQPADLLAPIMASPVPLDKQVSIFPLLIKLILYADADADAGSNADPDSEPEADTQLTGAHNLMMLNLVIMFW